MTEKNDTSRLTEKYIFRNIRQEEITQTAEIEKICFPPNEACSYEHMEKRVEKAPELFLVAEDRATGKIAGFLNGLATDREHLTDDFFTDAEMHDPKGKNIMLLGLDVLPEYQHQGLARHGGLAARCGLLHLYAAAEGADAPVLGNGAGVHYGGGLRRSVNHFNAGVQVLTRPGKGNAGVLHTGALAL